MLKNTETPPPLAWAGSGGGRGKMERHFARFVISEVDSPASQYERPPSALHNSRRAPSFCGRDFALSLSLYIYIYIYIYEIWQVSIRVSIGYRLGYRLPSHISHGTFRHTCRSCTEMSQQMIFADRIAVFGGFRV